MPKTVGNQIWKSFDWAVMERLHAKGFISDPVGKAKSVIFTEQGLRQLANAVAARRSTHRGSFRERSA